MDQREMAAAFRASADRTDVALVTNHGYAGAQIPVGGAADTGGQNMYVNAMAMALDRAGYRVTVFARGGFAFFRSERLRQAPEYLSGHVRYVFVPGGGETFIRKEDIAVALDEQALWLDAFVRREAAARGCRPWEVYAFWNTHYWDAALLALRLVERWRDDVAADAIAALTEGVLPEQELAEMRRERHWLALGAAPTWHLGAALLRAGGSPARPLVERARDAARRWQEERGRDEVDTLLAGLDEALAPGGEALHAAIQPVAAAGALGAAVLAAAGEDAALRAALQEVDRHVWTPHSLGELKDENFRDKPGAIRRALKLCERRDHERVICRRTRLFAATSTEIAEKLRTHYGVEASGMIYFPPGIDTDLFRPHDDEELEGARGWLAQISGLPEETLRGRRVVFETSRMDRTKRKDVLIDAFARVAADHPDWLLFIGGGPDNAVLAALRDRIAGDRTLSGRAFVTGFIPQVHIGPLFSLADLFVSASEMEGFGMSVSQAAASGTAVVSSDLIPFSLQYVPEDALVVRAGDVEAFATAMGRLMGDDAERARRGQALRQRTMALNWDRLVRAFVAELKRAGCHG